MWIARVRRAVGFRTYDTRTAVFLGSHPPACAALRLADMESISSYGLDGNDEKVLLGKWHRRSRGHPADATGARTFLSAASPESEHAAAGSQATWRIQRCCVAADKNVRAPARSRSPKRKERAGCPRGSPLLLGSLWSRRLDSGWNGHRYCVFPSVLFSATSISAHDGACQRCS